jgi:predicted RNA-binding Zn-ribbon protein involved in translation (DUF1610 family)
MSPEINVQQKQCFECGFENTADSEKWATTTHPSLGSVTQCPECGSTNIHSA